MALRLHLLAQPVERQDGPAPRRKFDGSAHPDGPETSELDRCQVCRNAQPAARVVRLHQPRSQRRPGQHHLLRQPRPRHVDRDDSHWNARPNREPAFWSRNHAMPSRQSFPARRQSPADSRTTARLRLDARPSNESPTRPTRTDQRVHPNCRAPPAGKHWRCDVDGVCRACQTCACLRPRGSHHRRCGG